MALQYLPAEHIAPVFHQLEDKAFTAALQTLWWYIRATWIENQTWPTTSWSVFMQAIRTNNDVEG